MQRSQRRGATQFSHAAHLLQSRPREGLARLASPNGGARGEARRDAAQPDPFAPPLTLTWMVCVAGGGERAPRGPRSHPSRAECLLELEASCSSQHLGRQVGSLGPRQSMAWAVASWQGGALTRHGGVGGSTSRSCATGSPARALPSKGLAQTCKGGVLAQGVLQLLPNAERRLWPKAWQDFFGWKLTWREVPWWLQSIGIRVPRAVRSARHAALGSVYIELISRVETSPNSSRPAAATMSNGAHAPRTAWELSSRNEERDDLHAMSGLGVHELLRSTVLPRRRRRQLVLSAAARLARRGARLPALCPDDQRTQQRLSQPCDRGRGGRQGTGPPEAALRDACHDRDRRPASWSRLVASLARPADGRTRATPHATPPGRRLSRANRSRRCNYVCLGCPTPRILLHNLKCGQCGMRAVVSTEEYMATFRFGADGGRLSPSPPERGGR